MADEAQAGVEGIGVTEADLLSLVGELLPREGQGFVTTKEIAASTGRTIYAVRLVLWQLKDRGLLVKGKKTLSAEECLSDRRPTVDAYALKTGGGC